MLHAAKPKPTEYGYYDFPKVVPIAPASEQKFSSLDIQAEKKKYTTKSNPYVGAQAASIARRNARERNRVKQVNDGFNALRKRLPATVVAALSGSSRRGSGKKLSKVDTLKMVVEYIKHLQSMINESDIALGITRTNTYMDTSYEDEGIYGGQNSPYSESLPSPAGSECSSGVSSAYSNNGCYQIYQVSEQISSVNENELLDAISWWQEK